MADKNLAAWADSKGITLYDGVAVLEQDGYVLSYALVPGNNLYAVSVPIEEASWSKEIHKQLKPLFKKIGGIGFAKAAGAVQVTVSAMSQKGRLEKFEQATQLLLSELPKLGVRPLSACRYCGESGCDDKMVENNICYPAHGRCKEEKAQKIIAEIEHNIEHGNILLGLLGAILGGIVGGLPNVVLAAMGMEGNYYLYILIPPCSYLGYKLFKGVLTRAVPFIIAIVSIICTVIQEFLFTYSVIARYGSSLGISYSIKEFISDVMIDREFMAEIMIEGMKSIGFCVLGIIFTWGYISRNNKHKLQEAEKLRQSIGR